MSSYFHVVKALSETLLAGTITVDDMEARCVRVFGQKYPWLHGLCERVMKFGLHNPSKLSGDHLIGFIKRDEGFNSAWRNQDHRPRIRYFSASPEKMREPPSALAQTFVPPLPTTDDLSKWLKLSHGQIKWYAGYWNRVASKPTGRLHHYTYKWVPTSNDTARLLEAPKKQLREIQRKIYQEILNKIPAHPSAHGFIRGRSCLTFCKPHTNKEIVLRIDLKRFFTSIRYGRILGLFRTIGYPRGTSGLLAGLCTNRVPDNILYDMPGFSENEARSWSARKIYQHPHLPQGAPTSPMLANLSAYRLDLRMNGIARWAGASYTRYADDLAFSGGVRLEKRIYRFYILACAIAIEEGFEVNTRKTKIMRQGRCQKLTGIVVNKHANIKRKDFDRLKATLYNCVRYGPATQNHNQVRDFKAHLAGKIAYVNMINPKRAHRLKMLFKDIQWDP